MLRPKLTRTYVDYINSMKTSSGIYLGATRSISSPKGTSKMGCLCLHEDVYSIKCCKGAMQSQGVGNMSATRNGSFSNGFSNGFDIKIN
jgi:hypothetical protein